MIGMGKCDIWGWGRKWVGETKPWKRRFSKKTGVKKTVSVKSYEALKVWHLGEVGKCDIWEKKSGGKVSHMGSTGWGE